MAESYNLDEVAKRLKPALDFYKNLDYQAKGKLFGTTNSSDIDNVIALAVLMHDGKVTPQINLDELAKKIEAGVVPEIDLERLAETVAAKIQIPGTAPEIDYNKLASRVAEKVEGRLGSGSGDVPYVKVLYEGWGIDHPDDIPGDVKIISDYLMSKGWEPESCILKDEKILFDGKISLTQEKMVENYEDGESFSLYYKKNDNVLRVEFFPINEEAHIYLTDYFPDFKQGVDDIENDNHLAPKTKRKLAAIATDLSEKFMGDDFDPEENNTDPDTIKILEMADRLGLKEEE